MRNILTKFFLTFFFLWVHLNLFAYDHKDFFIQDSSLLFKLSLNEPAISSVPNLYLEENTQKESIDFFRKSEIIFFISLPFTILYTNFLNNIFLNIIDITIILNGYRPTGSVGLRPTGTINNFFIPSNLFIWINPILWSGVISFNYPIEKLFKSELSTYLNSKDQYRYRYDMSFYQSSF